MAELGTQAVIEEPTLSLHEPVTVELGDLQALFDALISHGFQVFGPTVRDGAIVYDELKSLADLPTGWTDSQDNGNYSLAKRKDDALFAYSVGPHSWKRFLFPPAIRLWQAERADGTFKITAENLEDVPKMAFLGVRSCELSAIAIQDRVLMGGPYVDPGYKARREKTFIVAVNCGVAGGTCFCVSMNRGPKASSGFDIALTEVIENGRHYFVAEAGTKSGQEILGSIPSRSASEPESAAARRIVENTAAQMGRSLDTTDIKNLLYRNYEHPRWESIAARCLCCANCTMVCPTCFCTNVEDVTDLTGAHAERWRKWDSCFTVDFSYIHGGSVRSSAKSRYRQWMTHKLAAWIDQFGTSGCVGCGRCITWCPAGIDMTAEVRAIREEESSGKNGRPHGPG